MSIYGCDDEPDDGALPLPLLQRGRIHLSLSDHAPLSLVWAVVVITLSLPNSSGKIPLGLWAIVVVALSLWNPSGKRSLELWAFVMVALSLWNSSDELPLVLWAVVVVDLFLSNSSDEIPLGLRLSSGTPSSSETFSKFTTSTLSLPLCLGGDRTIKSSPLSSSSAESNASTS